MTETSPEAVSRQPPPIPLPRCKARVCKSFTPRTLNNDGPLKICPRVYAFQNQHASHGHIVRQIRNPPSHTKKQSRKYRKPGGDESLKCPLHGEVRSRLALSQVACIDGRVGPIVTPCVTRSEIDQTDSCRQLQGGDACLRCTIEKKVGPQEPGIACEPTRPA